MICIVMCVRSQGLDVFITRQLIIISHLAPLIFYNIFLICKVNNFTIEAIHFRLNRLQILPLVFSSGLIIARWSEDVLHNGINKTYTSAFFSKSRIYVG